MLEPEPSGWRQSAPGTGSHQGALATASEMSFFTSSDNRCSGMKELPNFSACAPRERNRGVRAKHLERHNQN